MERAHDGRGAGAGPGRCGAHAARAAAPALPPQAGLEHLDRRSDAHLPVSLSAGTIQLGVVTRRIVPLSQGRTSARTRTAAALSSAWRWVAPNPRRRAACARAGRGVRRTPAPRGRVSPATPGRRARAPRRGAPRDSSTAAAGLSFIPDHEPLLL